MKCNLGFAAVLHAPAAKLRRVLVGSGHSGHPVVQWRRDLVGHDCLSLFGNENLLLG